jgi:hypothetical protein
MNRPNHFRAVRSLPPNSPALVHRSELLSARHHLDRLRIHHIDLTSRFLRTSGGSLYGIDLVFMGAMARSYSVVDGFLNAFDTWNPIVAAPLVRIQIDTLVRVAYMARAPRADEIALHVLGGGEFRQLRDGENKRLTDKRLLEHAEPSHPWLSPVYEATSGWVHFSPAHVRAAVQLRVENEKTVGISGAVPIRPEEIPVSALQELIGAMVQATEELFGYVEVWESRKGLPTGYARRLEPAD